MKHAFSLIELSIVLVILGLLTGGILAGQSLIRAAELRAVTTEYGRYVTAMQTFREKYFALPGDITNATKFWGAAGAAGNACKAAAETSTTGTCDGNGNGILEGAVIYEPSTFWTHLARAGLIEGQYVYLNGALPTLGTHVPKSKLGSNAGWHVCSMLYGSYSATAENMFVFGGPGHSSSTCAMGLAPGLKAEDTWNIDTKMDDGRATYGRMTATNSYDVTSGCVTNHGFTTEAVGDEYLLTSTSKPCRFYIKF